MIVFDLDSEPDALLDLPSAEIAERMYTPAAALPGGTVRIPLKEVHLNKCPSLVAWDHLRDEDLQRLRIDPGEIERRVGRLRAAGPALAEKIRRVYADDRLREPSDVDASLYNGFIGDGDKRRFAAVRATAPRALASRAFGFQDPRLPEIMFRYRARNWPDTLTAEERAAWNAYRRLRLDTDDRLSEYSFASFNAEISALRTVHAGDGHKLSLLEQLQSWGRDIQAELQ